MKRQTKKTVTVQGRTFEIRSFDAMTGSYIAYLLLEKMLPQGMEKAMTAEGVSALPAGRQPMSKAEFTALQKDVLSVVGEVLPARTAPILNKNGSWGVADMEDNPLLVLILTVQALAFNIGGFFGGGGLKELQTALSDIVPPNMPT